MARKTWANSTSVKAYAISGVTVVIATGLLWALHSHLDKAHVGLLYLLVVASVSVAIGTRAALFAALLSFWAWDYFFLPPFFTLSLDDPRDWLLLFTFLVIAIIIGQLTGRMREREAEARARERDTAALYKAILGVNAETRLTPLVEQAVASTGAIGCAILLVSPQDRQLIEVARSGHTEGLKDEESQRIAKWGMEQAKAVGLGPPPTFSAKDNMPWPISVSHQEVSFKAKERSDVYLPLCAGEQTFGVMVAIPETGERFTTDDCRLLTAFASNAATFLERRRLIEESAQISAARETERLKSVLFSSLSHNLKTPLASLTTTLSSLQQEEIAFDKLELKEHLRFMAEDLQRLTEYIENLLNLAQLESGSWRPHQEWVELQEIISIALRRLPENEYRRIQIRIPAGFPFVWVDLVQMSQVVRHLVENAIRYSPLHSSVEVSVSEENGEINLCVEDQGPGIPLAEQQNVFRKFYRGQAAAKMDNQGTGLGLAICHEIIQTHGGTITAEASKLGGACLRVRIPMKKGGNG